MPTLAVRAGLAALQHMRTRVLSQQSLSHLLLVPSQSPVYPCPRLYEYRYRIPLCADGNSMGQGAHGCENKPGYEQFSSDRIREMMERHQSSLHWHTSCVWAESGEGPEDRSGCQYNESA